MGVKLEYTGGQAGSSWGQLAPSYLVEAVGHGLEEDGGGGDFLLGGEEAVRQVTTVGEVQAHEAGSHRCCSPRHRMRVCEWWVGSNVSYDSTITAAETRQSDQSVLPSQQLRRTSHITGCSPGGGSKITSRGAPLASKATHQSHPGLSGSSNPPITSAVPALPPRERTMPGERRTISLVVYSWQRGSALP